MIIVTLIKKAQFSLIKHFTCAGNNLVKNSHRKAIRYFIIFLIAVSPNFENPPDAGATGNAFRYTKHGGGTVDGIPYSGVDRGVNYDDYTLFYNENPEAGKYNPGECAHCHEPHASLGKPSRRRIQAGTPGPTHIFS